MSSFDSRLPVARPLICGLLCALALVFTQAAQPDAAQAASSARYMKFLSAPTRLIVNKNGSFNRLTWTVEANRGVVVTRLPPLVQTLGAGQLPPVAVEWQAPFIQSRSITFIGDVRGPCGSVGASYQGVGISGSACVSTLGHVKIKAEATKDGPIKFTTSVSTTKVGRWFLRQAKFKLTNGVIR